MAKKSETTKKSPAKKPSGKAAASKANTPQPRPIRREAGAVICLFLGIFSCIGYFDVSAWFIDFFCGLVKGLIGWGFYIFPPCLFVAAFILAMHRGRPVRLRVVSALILPLFAGAFMHLILCSGAFEFESGFVKALFDGGKAMECGGVVSGVLAMCLDGMVSIYGAAPVLLLAFAFFAMTAANISMSQIIDKIKNRPKTEYEYEYVPEPEPEPLPPKAPKQPKRRFLKHAIDIPLDGVDEPEYEENRTGFFNSTPRVKTPDQFLGEPDAPDYEPLRESEPVPIPVREPEPEILPDVPPAAPVDEPAVYQEISDPPKPKKMKKQEIAGESAKIAQTIENVTADTPETYEFPPLNLLRGGNGVTVDGRGEIAANRERLDSTLKSFGVPASIANVTRGPTVTRYDLELEAGVKLNKLTNLAGDLALSLGVSSVRVAPIPDRISTVGVEVPNKAVSIVYLRDIIDSPEFQKAPSKLTFAIGKDIGGNAIVGNIAKLPHMLIAGTTGSGKSVCMNSLILSILYKATPDEVRLIMIDPKMVELGVYNGIPHLYIPVVTDPKKAAGALQWAVVEMLKRYRMFSEVGVRDLAGYNSYQRRVGEPTLQQVVIVIDELADLMLVASKEVEESICRVAQMGRASGMHLVIATQRPSADVITGLMKANIPSRIAFNVSSAMESRIILDTQGAEKLIGAGDMLYSPIGAGKPMRVQGAFISDEEREEVINYVKSKTETRYSEEILHEIDIAAQSKGGGSNGRGAEPDTEPVSDYDDMLPQAVDVIFETKQASVSLLQRRLKLGYSRAARIVDQMEELGVVGPFEGSKPRQIIMTKEQWQEKRLIHGGAPTSPMQMEFSGNDDDDDPPWDDED